ncbi:hypothetical protein E2C01_082292 [Portunus trituberculatus]|uniref:Uncharacterized protein n=1 Tax=Portunus trituberculatus TaxID=210409 RepID=A0A5B7IRZ2_PORTR|nr:hypothetical protein [Portunus trituberculatus]
MGCRGDVGSVGMRQGKENKARVEDSPQLTCLLLYLSSPWSALVCLSLPVSVAYSESPNHFLIDDKEIR